MKSIKQIREQYDLITESEENEERKLTSLIRAGLVDTNKLPLIKRAMNKDNRVLTPAERNALMSLLNSLMAQVLSSNPVYQKVRQNVMKEELRPATTRMSDMPSILVLKRKAIRVYPGGQNVGLYYSQQLDRYVAVPFGGRDKVDPKSSLSMTEEVEQIDEISDELRYDTFAKRVKKTRDAPFGSSEQLKHLKKAAKTAVNTVARGARKGGTEQGKEDYLDMQNYANQYYQSQKKQQKSNNKKKTKSTGSNAQSGSGTSGRRKLKIKARSPGEEWNRMDRQSRGTGSLVGDVIRNVNSGRSNPISHAVASGIYRMRYRNTPKMPANFQVSEAFPLAAIPYVAAGARAAATSTAGRAVIGAGTRFAGRAKGALKRLWGKMKGKKRVAAGGAAAGYTAGSSGSSGSSNSNEREDTSKNRTATVRARVSKSQEEMRNLAQAKQFAATGYSSPIRESVQTIDLNGNLFDINTSVAQKVVSVYQSLNEQNRQKMVDKMNESEESLNKVISFAIRH